jgi:opacity protein-like surface antigen
MVRRSSVIWSAGVGFALCLTASSLQAQLEEVSEKRFEFTPIAGYQWGGSFDTDALSTAVPAGELQLKDSFAWGGILSFLYGMRGAVEISYVRQDTDISFNPFAGAGETDLGGFAINYIQIGGRQGFGTGTALQPFITVNLGIGIFDPKAESIGSETRFSWGFGGGAIYMFSNQRIGLRSDIKMAITPVPSGEYGTWCDFYGCFVAEGTAWVTQGQLTGGLVFAF